MKISNKSLLVATIATALSSGIAQGSAFLDTTDSSTRRSTTINPIMGISKAAISDGKMYVNSKILSEDKDGVLELAPQASQIQFDLWGTNPFLKDVKFGKDAQVSISCNVENIPYVEALINKNAKQNISLLLMLYGYVSPENLRTLVQPLSQLPSVTLMVNAFALKSSEDRNRNAIFLKDELEKIGKSVNLLDDFREPITDEQLAKIKASFLKEKLEKIGKSINLVDVSRESITDAQLAKIKAYSDVEKSDFIYISDDEMYVSELSPDIIDEINKLAKQVTNIHFDLLFGNQLNTSSEQALIKGIMLSEGKQVRVDCSSENIPALIKFLGKNNGSLDSFTLLLDGQCSSRMLAHLAQTLVRLKSVNLVVRTIVLRCETNRNALFLKRALDSADPIAKIGRSVKLVNPGGEPITKEQLEKIEASLRSED